jgi:hypothetical protein
MLFRAEACIRTAVNCSHQRSAQLALLGAHVATRPPTLLPACPPAHPLGRPPTHSPGRCSPAWPSAVEAEYPASVKAMLGRWGMVNVKGHQHTRLK